jgi:hypothetical protein
MQIDESDFPESFSLTFSQLTPETVASKQHVACLSVCGRREERKGGAADSEGD